MPPPPEDNMCLSAALTSMELFFVPDLAQAMDTICEVHIEHEVFHAHIQNGAIEILRSPAHKPDVMITTDLNTFLAVISGMFTVAMAVDSGMYTIDKGDVAQVTEFMLVFKLPVMS